MNIYGKVVYLACPYSIGDKEVNVEIAINATNFLIDLGAAYVICPLLSHYLDKAQPRLTDFWYHYDMTALDLCDVLVWLDGESKGVVAEIARAEELEMPVIFFNDLLQ